MTSPSREALGRALRIDDVFESINQVKSIVGDSLRQADPRATVVRTSYFNHTYVPDMVLEWPGRGANASREVFIRSAVDPRRIELDVEAHAAEHPMFIHLSAFDRSAERGDAQKDTFMPVEAVALRTSSLVTDIGAIGELTGSGKSPASQLLPPSMLHGGKGLIDEVEARTTAEVVENGFNGALAGDRDSTSSALDVITEILTPSAATELTSYMETMWIASGQDPMAFPGAIHDLGSHMPARRLRELLSALSDGPDEFWRKVGLSVDLESFLGLNLVGEQQALQSLVSAALPKLNARSCRVLTTENAGAAADSSLMWQVENGTLSLRGRGRQAWVGVRKSDLPRLPETYEPRVPSPSKLAARASSSGIPIQSVELVGNDRAVVYRSDAEANITGDELVGTFDSALGTPSVPKATAVVNAKLLTINFEDSASQGRPNSIFPVSRLIWSTWAMLSDPTPEETADLRSTLLLDEDGQTGHAAAAVASEVVSE